MGELACGIDTIKVESVWHRVPTNLASSQIPPSPLVLADGGGAASYRLPASQEARSEDPLGVRGRRGRRPPSRRRGSAPLAAWASAPYPWPGLRERERESREGGRERGEEKGKVDVAR
uniref:Uncharacterized protein n=1 Tax=Oryza nivara TaxID=4536 RepID=A0A0E0IVC2_ORYNI